jgi:xanthine dehydrogenase YagS FAD-binding subunit
MCVALAALEATVLVTGSAGERAIPFADFHRLPGTEPERDSTLQPGELITAIELAPDGFAPHSVYLKIRDRASYAFALVSVAAALALEGGKIREARIALGGVAHKPWRNLAAEALLLGAVPGEAAFQRAADVIVSEARGYAHNGFKIELARRAVVRALAEAADLGPHS